MSTDTDAPVAQLRAARLRKGVSQADVAVAIGTTQSAVARLEADQSDPRLGTVRRYAEALGLRLTFAPATTHDPSLAGTADDVRAALANGDPDQALRHVIQFLDDVQRLAAAVRPRAVTDEPATTASPQWDALLAGIAEYAGLRFGFPVPGWAAAPGRFLHRFWFVIEDVIGRPMPGLAALAFVKSPSPLASRGVFLDGDSLLSV